MFITQIRVETWPASLLAFLGISPGDADHAAIRLKIEGGAAGGKAMELVVERALGIQISRNGTVPLAPSFVGTWEACKGRKTVADLRRELSEKGRWTYSAEVANCQGIFTDHHALGLGRETRIMTAMKLNRHGYSYLVK